MSVYLYKLVIFEVAVFFADIAPFSQHFSRFKVIETEMMQQVCLYR